LPTQLPENFSFEKKKKSTKKQEKSNSIKDTKFWKLNMKKIGKTANNIYKKNLPIQNRNAHSCSV